MNQTPEISVVIPLYNEVENVEDLCRELKNALDPIGRPYEVLLVDDGSRDGTGKRALELAKADPAIRVLRLRRNFGQTAAFSAGFDHARGRVVVTSDGDLQNDPQDIGPMLRKLDEGEGYDIVCGWRK
ncbi:MAG: glycosyltransferase family 2 protein, partial [Vicinamibacteria bacterium]